MARRRRTAGPEHADGIAGLTRSRRGRRARAPRRRPARTSSRRERSWSRRPPPRAGRPSSARSPAPCSTSAGSCATRRSSPASTACPPCVGTGTGTKRIRTGDRLRVDGAGGRGHDPARSGKQDTETERRLSGARERMELPVLRNVHRRHLRSRPAGWASARSAQRGCTRAPALRASCAPVRASIRRSCTVLSGNRDGATTRREREFLVQPSRFRPNGAAQESNLPSVGLPRLTGFEDRLRHRPRRSASSLAALAMARTPGTTRCIGPVWSGGSFRSTPTERAAPARRRPPLRPQAPPSAS